MVAIALSVLALAAGVHLLIKTKKEFLGGLYSLLAWLVIALSLGSIGTSAYCMLKCCDENRCTQKCGPQSCKTGGTSTCQYAAENKTCSPEGCSMSGCRMEGDSCVLEKEKCESIFGKEACDSIVDLRGRCIFSKEECKANICGKQQAKCSSGAKKDCCKKP